MRVRLNSGEFETEQVDGSFDIHITQESELSLDGGYSFESVTNIFELNSINAKALVEELQHYIDKQK